MHEHEGAADVLRTSVPLVCQIERQMGVQCVSEQPKPVLQQLRSETRQRVLLGNTVRLVAIPLSAERHPPEMRKMLLVLRPIAYDSERACERRVPLHSLVEIAHYFLHLGAPELAGNVFHESSGVFVWGVPTISRRDSLVQ